MVLHGTRRVSARQGWAGGSLAFLSILLTIQTLSFYCYISVSHKNQVSENC
jgi:hypothetical protein